MIILEQPCQGTAICTYMKKMFICPVEEIRLHHRYKLRPHIPFSPNPTGPLGGYIEVLCKVANYFPNFQIFFCLIFVGSQEVGHRYPDCTCWKLDFWCPTSVVRRRLGTIISLRSALSIFLRAQSLAFFLPDNFSRQLPTSSPATLGTSCSPATSGNTSGHPQCFLVLSPSSSPPRQFSGIPCNLWHLLP